MNQKTHSLLLLRDFTAPFFAPKFSPPTYLRPLLPPSYLPPSPHFWLIPSPALRRAPFWLIPSPALRRAPELE